MSLETKKQQLADLEASNSSLQTDINNLKEEKSYLAGQISILSSNLEVFTENRDKLNTAIEEHNNNLANIEIKVNSLLSEA